MNPTFNQNMRTLLIDLRLTINPPFLSKDKSRQRFSLGAAGWFSMLSTRCLNASGQEIAQSPDPPQGCTETTIKPRSITAM